MIVNLSSIFLQTITQAHVIPQPVKQSGLNPSGVPYSSQLNCPSEIIQTPFTSDVASYPSFDLIPDHTSSTNISSIYNLTMVQGDNNGFSTNLSLYNLTMAQGDNGFEALMQTTLHCNNEPPSSAPDNFPYDANLLSLVPSLLSNTDWYFPGECGVESMSHSRSCYNDLQ